ncbi:ester cyclase [Lysinibacillus louembei]|uniref:Ester cyclase n=1 Tax=Lysinibacillus louembei TaxID=1470088 RepID=A0ABZ0S0M6_9BACI|nr:ester cyclase [Lysinibacillus louembei]WPK13965.1 ester cyclase [Lysinibacillus louembei]
MNDSLLQTNEQILKSFYEIVRTGRHPERAELFMAKEVKAHQINSENMVTIIRSPQNYADHIREMKDSWGNFKIEIEELITQNQKVYVRWKQIGIHIGEYEGYQPTNKEVVELGSAIYRLENQKIVEYWIQVDRLGIIEQLKKNQEAD